MTQRCQCGAARGKGDFCQYCGADIRTGFERNVDKIVEVSKPAMQQVKSVARTGLIFGIIVAVFAFIVFGVVVFFIIKGISSTGLEFKGVQMFQKLFTILSHQLS